MVSIMDEEAIMLQLSRILSLVSREGILGNVIIAPLRGVFFSEPPGIFSAFIKNHLFF